MEVDYPEKIGKLFVDSEKIAWVLTNLLSNAVRYSSEAGRVVIGARQQDDNHIAMFVQDFGKGIDRVTTKVFSSIISVCRVRKCREPDWVCPFPGTLWKLTEEH